MLEEIFCDAEVKASDTNDGTRKITFKVVNNAKARFQLFTSHLKRFGSTAKVLEFILVQHCSKTAINENVEVSHKQVDGFCWLRCC